MRPGCSTVGCCHALPRNAAYRSVESRNCYAAAVAVVAEAVAAAAWTTLSENVVHDAVAFATRFGIAAAVVVAIDAYTILLVAADAAAVAA